MIKYVKGNLFQADTDIIAHQVNCMGVWGAGVAKQMKAQYPLAYEKYVDIVKRTLGIYLLGNCQIVRIAESSIKPNTIANIFGQYNYGRDKRYTDYTAIERGLERFHASAGITNKSIAIPYKIGCGLGGGEWEKVKLLIEEIFSDEVVLKIYRLED